jgi:DNA polymerase-3 subunit delta'
MALKEIFGQEKAITQLRGSMRKNRIPHAYLFTGDDGIGKKLTAVNLAKTLNCLNNRDMLWVRGEGVFKSGNTFQITDHEIDCCDVCPSCTKIEKNLHPDVFLISGDGGQIKVETIRQLEESFSYKSFEGGWKVAIIDDADRLTPSATNAFLKTLEEPPDMSLIILVSCRAEFITETVHSRCQIVRFSPLSFSSIEEMLRVNNTFAKKVKDIKSMSLLGVLSGGRPGLILREDILKKRDSMFDEFTTLIQKPDEKRWEGKESMEEWFEWAPLWLRDVAVYKITGSTDLLINSDRVEDMKTISKKANLHDILKLAETFDKIYKLLRFNLNKKVTLHYTHFLLRKTFG